MRLFSCLCLLSGCLTPAADPSPEAGADSAADPSVEPHVPVDGAEAEPEPEPAEEPEPEPSPEPEPEPEGPRHVYAIGDVHGDLQAAVSALELVGAIDQSQHWIGGDMLVVQVGDQLDRGPDERAILDLFEELRIEADTAGGGFYPLVGNHETMNVEEDLRYVTDEGFDTFANVPFDPADPRLQPYYAWAHGRIAAFLPGGPYALMLAEHPMILELEGSVFVHGGVLPEHATYGVDAINAEVAAWMRGQGPQPDAWIGSDSPVWSRHYSDETGPGECQLLEDTLSILGASRMVVAHTVQPYINPACDEQVWRVDVGLADYYGGPTQVLSIFGDQVHVLEL